MYIKDIKWLDEINREAIVIITNDKIEIECFSHPLEKNKNDIINNIYCINVENVCISTKDEYKINYNEESMKYIISGKLKNRETGIITFEDLEMDISKSYIPIDIKEGEFICFNASRLDIW